MFYVQHLLGVGHVYRATRIARALAKQKFQVHLVWGGTQLPGFDFSDFEVHYLPPVRTGDASFSDLLHADGRAFSQADKNERKSQLLGLFADISPDILMTEAFPFGRRQMLFELIPLLDAVKERSRPPLVIASIRDIMQEGRKQSRVEESCELINQYYDHVFVHGDPNLIQIEDTLQGAARFFDKIKYTGLVTPEPNLDTIPSAEKCDVLVSVGGGAFGKQLLETALSAHGLVPEELRNWRVTTGTEMSDSDFQAIQDAIPRSIKLVRHITDLQLAMRGASVSVSHAGYNTVADILRSGCKNVLYPHIGGKETEQLRRAQKLAELGVSTMVNPADFSAETLAKAIITCKNSSANAHGLDLDGADHTAELLSKLISSSN